MGVLFSLADDINNLGQIVGSNLFLATDPFGGDWAAPIPTVWSAAGKATRLPIPDGYNAARASAINNSGKIVGALSRDFGYWDWSAPVIWQEVIPVNLPDVILSDRFETPDQ